MKDPHVFHFECSAGFLLPVIILLLITVSRFGWSRGVLATALFILSLLAHELGHIAAAIANNIRISALGLCKWGAYLRREQSEGTAELVTAAAGPAVNLLLAYFFRETTGIFPWLAQMNAFLFFINILPFGPTDGKRILNHLRGRHAAQRALSSVSPRLP